MPADIDVYSTYTDPAKLRQFVGFCNKIKIFRAPSARIKEVNCGLVGAGAYALFRPFYAHNSYSFVSYMSAPRDVVNVIGIHDRHIKQSDSGKTYTYRKYFRVLGSYLSSRFEVKIPTSRDSSVIQSSDSSGKSAKFRYSTGLCLAVPTCNALGIIKLKNFARLRRAKRNNYSYL